MKLAILLPISWDFVPTPFLASMLQLMRPREQKALARLGIDSYFYLVNRNFPLDLNRNQLAEKALELGAEWMLFLDADMTFPPRLVSALVEDALVSKAAVVSACYFKKRPPHPCVSALRKNPEDPQLLSSLDPFDPKRRENPFPGSEQIGRLLVECDVVGMGATLIHSEVFRAVSGPWFEYEVYEKTGERVVSEDVPFCRKVKEAGFTILTDLSLVCGHLRQVEVDEEDWRRCRAALLAERRQSPEEGASGEEDF